MPARWCRSRSKVTRSSRVSCETCEWPQARVSTVISYILTSYQPDFAVVRGGNLLGVVVNFSCHATTNPGGISANWIWSMEKTLRGAVAAGVLEWNKAFEKAGFAIMHADDRNTAASDGHKLIGHHTFRREFIEFIVATRDRYRILSIALIRITGLS